jgi:hypothetical protein
LQCETGKPACLNGSNICSIREAAHLAPVNDFNAREYPRWMVRDDLEAAYETTRQAARTWDAALVAYAGVILSIAHDGEAVAAEGLVRKQDQKRLVALQTAT